MLVLLMKLGLLAFLLARRIASMIAWRAGAPTRFRGEPYVRLPQARLITARSRP